MTKEYRVIDLSKGAVDPNERIVAALSPQAAGQAVTGVELIRSGAKKDLIARVYWQVPGTPTNMVRLCQKVGDPRTR